MIRRAATARGRAQIGCFSIEGTRLHERALRAGIQVQRAVVGTGFWRSSEPRIQDLLAGLRAGGCRLTEIPDEVLFELTGGRDLGAILGLVALPPQPNLASMIKNCRRKPIVFLAAVDVVDPGNLGAMIRSALAGGAAGFICVGGSDPFHPKTLRTTMGSLFKLPILRVESYEVILQDCHEQDVWTLGTAVTGGIPLPSAPLNRDRLAVFMGSEASGLPIDLLAKLNMRLTIPMVAGIDSYSVNAAAAIVLYEIQRQKIFEK